MIPPQPIIEDEEKELGTLEILERNLGQICQLADQGNFKTKIFLLTHSHIMLMGLLFCLQLLPAPAS
jgi:hypothetical protein